MNLPNIQIPHSNLYQNLTADRLKLCLGILACVFQFQQPNVPILFHINQFFLVWWSLTKKFVCSWWSFFAYLLKIIRKHLWNSQKKYYERKPMSTHDKFAWRNEIETFLHIFFLQVKRISLLIYTCENLTQWHQLYFLPKTSCFHKIHSLFIIT